MKSRSLFLAFCCAVGGCGGTVVDLGAPRPPPYVFGLPRLVAELDVTYENQNPTLTADLLELYFTSARGDTNGDVWMARRAGPGDRFGVPALVADVSSPMHEASPAIAFDGLSLYFGTDRASSDENLDIWVATRPDRSAAWTALESVATLNSAAKDIPRPPGQRGLVMPMSSERDSGGPGYQTYLAERPSLDQPFGVPAVVHGLGAPDSTIADAFLSDDGLTLFYAAAATGQAPDLFVAWRAATGDPFSLPTPLTDLNSILDERDPWLSPDGTVFYFTSDREGALQIYEVPATRQPW